MERRFKILRLIGTIYKVLGAITGVLTIVGALGICLMSVLGAAIYEDIQAELGVGGLISGAVGGVIIGGVILLYGAVMTLMLYGLGEGIYLLLALEENTRTTAITMQQYSSEPVVPEL